MNICYDFFSTGKPVGPIKGLFLPKLRTIFGEDCGKQDSLFGGLIP